MEKYDIKVDGNGTVRYYKPGTQIIHRTDGGPAVECVDGDKVWYQNGKCHRLDGPAVECVDGYKAWFQNGGLHRLDGPAVECANGDKIWYVDGVKLTEYEFREKTASSTTQ